MTMIESVLNCSPQKFPIISFFYKTHNLINKTSKINHYLLKQSGKIEYNEDVCIWQRQALPWREKDAHQIT